MTNHPSTPPDPVPPPEDAALIEAISMLPPPDDVIGEDSMAVWGAGSVLDYADARARHAVQRERERVVAWLRSLVDDDMGGGTSATVQLAADAISRGVHAKEEQ